MSGSKSVYRALATGIYAICITVAVIRAGEDYQIPYTPTAPEIDGVLRPGEWENALILADFSAPLNSPPQETQLLKDYPTTAHLLWRDATLYVAFVCRSPQPPLASLSGHDQPLFKEDVAEIFLRLQESPNRYGEFLVSPRGATLDILHRWQQPPTYPAEQIDEAQRHLHRPAPEWNLADFVAAGMIAPPAEGAPETRHSTWTTEAAIPLQELSAAENDAVKPGQLVWLNLLRYSYRLEEDGKRRHLQLNLVPTQKGRPHISPMACRRFVLAGE